jgi:hypothetical protein
MIKKFRIWDGEKFYFTTDKIDIYPAGFSDTFGLFFGITPNERIETGPSGYSKSKKITIEQFTGVLDQKRKEIYEGDIISGEFYNTEYHHSTTVIHPVVFNNGAFNISSNLWHKPTLKILGNLHQDSKLLA